MYAKFLLQYVVTRDRLRQSLQMPKIPKRTNMPEFSTKLDIDSQLLLETPKMVRVILLNDNYTEMEFVVEILQNIYSKSRDEAIAITLEIHKNGKAIGGIYPYDIGEVKVQETIKAAKEAQFPLKAYAESIE